MRRKFTDRKKKIDVNLAYAINFISAMASAGVTPTEIFKSLSKQRIYGEIRDEALWIFRDISILGKDIISAIKANINRTPSEKFKEFLQGAIVTVQSGGALKPYFMAKAEQYSRLIEPRKVDRHVHDLGFLFWPTWKRWFDLTNDPKLQTVVIEAGRTLALRYNEKGRYLRSFLAPDSSPSAGLLIQYFQKARFEYHNENAPGDRVVVSPLGVYLYDLEQLEERIEDARPVRLPVGAAAEAEPFVVVAGSLYLIGEAMELLHIAAAPNTDEKGLNDWTGLSPAANANPRPATLHSCSCRGAGTSPASRSRSHASRVSSSGVARSGWWR
jgi:hypothetical protein